jgi:tyrosyl-tRNA synthetase
MAKYIPMTNVKSDFLNIMQERGFVHQSSDLEGLDAALSAGMLTAYIGYDPTGMSLHVGHLYTIMMLYWFQKCGHRPITLMGGATALIGDPTMKDATRPLLSPDDIQKNIDSIKGIFGKFLNYGTSGNDAIMVNNYDWLKEKDYIGFLREIGTHFTINRMLSFDSVKTRLDRELPMSFLEFNYMIMQGYDFVELNRRYGATLQMGGSDQWGNIINGVELGRRMDQKQLFALTAPLLTTSAGKKMGKTEGGAVWLNADLTTPYEYYQYWRNIDDADVGKVLAIFTILPMDEVKRLAALEGSAINEAKKILAFEATKLCHGEIEAQKAAETAQKTFEQGGVGDELPRIEVPTTRLNDNLAVVDLLVELGLTASKGEARRAIQGNGIRVNDAVITDVNATVSANDVTAEGYIKFSSGKKKHVLLIAA